VSKSLRDLELRTSPEADSLRARDKGGSVCLPEQSKWRHLRQTVQPWPFSLWQSNGGDETFTVAMGHSFLYSVVQCTPQHPSSEHAGCHVPIFCALISLTMQLVPI
jgi:hypothetical protein